MAGSVPPAPSLQLEVLAERHALCRLDPGAPLPGWANAPAGAGSILVVGRSAEELSIVCPEALVPPDQPCRGGRRALRVSGTLDHLLTGVLASIAVPLADAGVPIFAVSTWDTDYVLVADEDLNRAVSALIAAGHRVAAAGPDDDRGSA